MITVEQIKKAHRRIRPYILQTPLIRSHWLSKICNGNVFLKLESEQYTGSFKARGSLNKLMWLNEQADSKFPVTASTGNHGLGFARALDLLDMEGRVYLPKNATPSKVEAIKAFGVEVKFHGSDPYTTELFARKTADDKDWIYVSPYNDAQVIEGQGTVGVEILDQQSEIDNILVTVGGGGLISGIATYTNTQSPNTSIIGCQPENSPEMASSVQAGAYQENVETAPTLSDGSAGGFERDSITFDICKKRVDDFMLISEAEIKEAIRNTIKHHHKLIEGSAGVAIASVLKDPQRFKNQKTAIVVCGANIGLETLKKIL